MKTDFYWPVFAAVAVLSTAAVWRFAPLAPLSDEMRSACVAYTHKALQCAGLEVTADAPRQQPAAPAKPAAEVADTPAAAPSSPPALPEKATPQTARIPPSRQAQAEPPKKARPVRAKPRPVPVQEKKPALAEASPPPPPEKPKTLTPEARKAQYDALTKKAEARKLEIMRENLNKSREGQKALAALKAFKARSAHVEALKEKYGPTDARVTRYRGELLKLRDEVRRTNEAYKRWKEKNADRLVVVEDDPAYRQILLERSRYEND